MLLSERNKRIKFGPLVDAALRLKVGPHHVRIPEVPGLEGCTGPGCARCCSVNVHPKEAGRDHGRRRGGKRHRVRCTNGYRRHAKPGGKSQARSRTSAMQERAPCKRLLSRVKAVHVFPFTFLRRAIRGHASPTPMCARDSPLVLRDDSRQDARQQSPRRSRGEAMSASPADTTKRSEDLRKEVNCTDVSRCIGDRYQSCLHDGR